MEKRTDSFSKGLFSYLSTLFNSILLFNFQFKSSQDKSIQFILFFPLTMLRISPLVSLKKKQPKGSILQEAESPPRKLIKLDDEPDTRMTTSPSRHHATTTTTTNGRDESEDELDAYIESIQSQSLSMENKTHDAPPDSEATEPPSENESESDNDFIVSYLDYLEKHPIENGNEENDDKEDREES